MTVWLDFEIPHLKFRIGHRKNIQHSTVVILVSQTNHFKVNNQVNLSPFLMFLDKNPNPGLLGCP